MSLLQTSDLEIVLRGPPQQWELRVRSDRSRHDRANSVAFLNWECVVPVSSTGDKHVLGFLN